MYVGVPACLLTGVVLFQIEWSSIVCNLINIPMSMFPEVRDTR